MSSNVCGTGTWSGPLPGDPDTSNTLLTATPAFGGIDVSWTAAVTNPHAVAHTYLYRSTANSDFLSALRIATVGGTHFYDKLEELATYYYWIQVVSINGTVGPVIGPASAVPRLSINETIIALTGRIDNGMLAQSLKTDIDKITLTAQDLDQEILDRVADTEYLGSQLTLLDNGVNASFGLVLNEINTLADNHNALAQSYSYLASSGGGASSAIEENNRAMIGYCLVGGVTSSENTPAECSVAGGTWVVAAPLAESVKTVQITDNDGNIASVQQLMQSYKDGLGDLGALYTAKVGVNGLIGGFGVYNDGTEVQAGFDVDTFWVGRTGPDKKKPFIIDSTTGEVFIDNAVINKLTADKIDSRGLTIKDASGNIILGSGNNLDWSRVANKTGFASISQITPSNVTTYIANAALGNAQIGGNLWSTDWNYAGGSGWFLNRNGNFYCNNIYARGDIEASSLKANTAIVQTLNIAGNAVIVPTYVEYPSSAAYDVYQNGTEAEWTLLSDVVTVNVDCSALIFIGCNDIITPTTHTVSAGAGSLGHYNWPTGTEWASIRLYRNGSLVKRLAQWNVSSTKKGNGRHTVTYSDYERDCVFIDTLVAEIHLVAGTNTIDIRGWVRMADGNGVAKRNSNSYMLIMGTQR